MPNYGPYTNFPGTPLWYAGLIQMGLAGGGGGTKQAPPNFSITQKVTVTQKFSANPGVLASGRRPDRPGLVP